MPEEVRIEHPRGPASYVRLNLSYLCSLPGALRIAEILTGILFCSLAGTFRVHGVSFHLDELKGAGWVLFVGSFYIIASATTLVIHLLGLPKALPHSVPVYYFEIPYATIASLAHMTAWMVEAYNAHRVAQICEDHEAFKLTHCGAFADLQPQYIAATIIGIAAQVIYGMDAFLQFRMWRGDSSRNFY